MAKKQDYGNDSITMLKGPDKVRKRPAVIFGSDGLDGCEHSIFEVISNSIDEARTKSYAYVCQRRNTYQCLNMRMLESLEDTSPLTSQLELSCG